MDTAAPTTRITCKLLHLSPRFHVLLSIWIFARSWTVVWCQVSAFPHEFLVESSGQIYLVTTSTQLELATKPSPRFRLAWSCRHAGVPKSVQQTSICSTEIRSVDSTESLFRGRDQQLRGCSWIPVAPSLLATPQVPLARGCVSRRAHTLSKDLLQ